MARFVLVGLSVFWYFVKGPYHWGFVAFHNSLNKILRECGPVWIDDHCIELCFGWDDSNWRYQESQKEAEGCARGIWKCNRKDENLSWIGWPEVSELYCVITATIHHIGWIIQHEQSCCVIYTKILSFMHRINFQYNWGHTPLSGI